VQWDHHQILIPTPPLGTCERLKGLAGLDLIVEDLHNSWRFVPVLLQLRTRRTVPNRSRSIIGE
jgi:hypothetical protein